MWDAACPCACVFACVVCLCVCVLSSWHSSTNLSYIQIFHSDGKRPDSNSIVPWKCPFPFVDVHFYNKICHVLKGQMPGLGQMWDPVMIFTCQIVSNPRLCPGGGGGGGSHVTMIGALFWTCAQASSPPKLLVNLSHQSRHRVVPEYLVGIANHCQEM